MGTPFIRAEPKIRRAWWAVLLMLILTSLIYVGSLQVGLTPFEFQFWISLGASWIMGWATWAIARWIEGLVERRLNRIEHLESPVRFLCLVAKGDEARGFLNSTRAMTWIATAISNFYYCTFIVGLAIASILYLILLGPTPPAQFILDRVQPESDLETIRAYLKWGAAAAQVVFQMVLIFLFFGPLVLSMIFYWVSLIFTWLGFGPPGIGWILTHSFQVHGVPFSQAELARVELDEPDPSNQPGLVHCRFTNNQATAQIIVDRIRHWKPASGELPFEEDQLRTLFWYKVAPHLFGTLIGLLGGLAIAFLAITFADAAALGHSDIKEWWNGILQSIGLPQV